MKICKIYANKQFKNVRFAPGFNVILGRIHDRTKSGRDTHNLGKTTLITVIDFLLLGDFDKKENVLANEVFQGQVFYMEIALNNGEYLLIKRGIESNTKICFKLNETELSDFEETILWDFIDLPLQKARETLEEYLDFNIARSWGYRKTNAYFMRKQSDFLDVFKLNKFRGKDKDWKPAVFELLGFDSSLVKQKYEKEEELEEQRQKKTIIEKDLGIDTEQIDRLKGLLDLKENNRNETIKKIDSFNFYEKDQAIMRELVSTVDFNIQTLNTERYQLARDIEKVESALAGNDKKVDLERIKELYEQVKISLPDQLLKSYQQLLDFNYAITQERRKILVESLKDLKNEYTNIDSALRQLENKKKEQLEWLTESDVYSKFKRYQIQLSDLESDIKDLRNKLRGLDKLTEMQERIEGISNEIAGLIKEIGKVIEQRKHSEINRIFNNIIQNILQVFALISIFQNRNGNIEFAATCQNPENLATTAEAYGNTYKKLLCIAFDLAILINYAHDSFYRFAYHDGALEGLDHRKKTLFINIVREMCKEYGIQYILTLIDSDLPQNEKGVVVDFPPEEIALELSDRDNSGRLFKIAF